MSVKYSLTFNNRSRNTGNACVYQTAPNNELSQVMSLAWFSKRAHPTTSIRFDWTIDYSFMWDVTSVLVPGVRFDASQNWPADLSTTNQVTFTLEDGAYTFKDQGKGTAGSLIIIQDGTLPHKHASVGIGMSGAGAFVVQAQPNLTEVFTPHPKYWITFGNYEAGQVMDTQSLTLAQELDFPENVYAMTVTLNDDNTWTVG
jgi:rhizosphere induced protein